MTKQSHSHILNSNTGQQNSFSLSPLLPHNQHLPSLLFQLSFICLLYLSFLPPLPPCHPPPSNHPILFPPPLPPLPSPPLIPYSPILPSSSSSPLLSPPLAIAHAMARDGSSGGVIRMVTIDQSGVEKQVILGTYSSLHVLTCAHCNIIGCVISLLVWIMRGLFRGEGSLY